MWLILSLPAPYHIPSNTASYSNQSYTLLGGSRQQAKGFALKHFTILHFLPRTIASTATKQVHQQISSRSHLYNSWLEYRSGPLPYLGQSHMLQSSYTSRCLADRIHITVNWIRIRRRIKGSNCPALSQGLSKSYAITSQGNWYTCI
jgi:hypothetical protein